MVTPSLRLTHDELDVSFEQTGLDEFKSDFGSDRTAGLRIPRFHTFCFIPFVKNGHTVFAKLKTWAKLLDVAKFRASHTDEWRMLLE